MSLNRGVSTALGRTFSFSDASVDVALPAASTSLGSSLTEQSHVFQRSTEPGLYLVKIRQIMSVAYQEMYFSGREPSAQPLPSIWARCAEAKEWFDQAPTNVPHHFPVLYRLEFLYTMVIVLSPSHKYPTLCDFNKVVLFDRCLDYIGQLHQALENPNVLPFMTLIDIQRAYQVGRRFVDLLSQDSRLLLRPSVPVAPPVPHGTPDPPFVSREGRTNCPARAIRCLTYAQNLLRYSARKWAVYSFLEQFERAGAPVRKWLTQPSVVFLPAGPGAFMAGPTTSGGNTMTTTTMMPPGGNHHPGFHYGPF